MKKINLEKYNGDNLPYPNEMFDKILSSLVFHHLKRAQKINALNELYRTLKWDGELHLLDFGKARNILMRIAFLIWQILDGYKNTNDNIQGLLPEMISNAGFSDIKENKRVFTFFGTLSFYSAIKKL